MPGVALHAVEQTKHLLARVPLELQLQAELNSGVSSPERARDAARGGGARGEAVRRRLHVLSEASGRVVPVLDLDRGDSGHRRARSARTLVGLERAEDALREDLKCVGGLFHRSARASKEEHLKMVCNFTETLHFRNVSRKLENRIF